MIFFLRKVRSIVRGTEIERVGHFNRKSEVRSCWKNITLLIIIMVYDNEYE